MLHENDNISYCHYFNNRKVCPFETVGCMLPHKLSNECRYGTTCRNKLCSFQHGRIMKLTSSGEERECDFCEYQYNSEGKIYTHIRIIQYDAAKAILGLYSSDDSQNISDKNDVK